MIRKTLAAAVAALALLNGASHAEDTVKLAVGQRGNWDTSVSEIGQRAGIFKKHGLTLELVYTQGAGETQQAVISGSVDLGIAAGVMGVLGVPMLLGPIAGPILGGWLIETASWHWIFLINVPIGAAALIYTYLALPKDDPQPSE